MTAEGTLGHFSPSLCGTGPQGASHTDPAGEAGLWLQSGKGRGLSWGGGSPGARAVLRGSGLGSGISWALEPLSGEAVGGQVTGLRGAWGQ